MVTVSGPPAILQALFQESKYFRQRTTISLDVFGSFHASHLYTDADIEEDLQSIAQANPSSAHSSILVISGINEAFLSETDLRQLSGALADILVRPLSFDGVISAVASWVRISGQENCNISSVGPSNALFSLVSTLKVETKLEVSIGA